ncbi:hypothetical protein AB0C12_43045 [Actinoplanes sp. NPDC048967]|uniref:hypothetical protein n=1 Tax=Actinoplanes sp. NPDC048967 TaxID=3155269 RepID=UPI00340D02E7
MLTIVELAAVPHATANGSLILSINTVTPAGETLGGLRDLSVATGLPVHRPVTITSRIGGYCLDLGVRSENVEITVLPADVDRLAATQLRRWFGQLLCLAGTTSDDGDLR